MQIPDKPLEPTSVVESKRTGTGIAQVLALLLLCLILLLVFGTTAQLISFEFGILFTEIVLFLVPAILFVKWKGLPLARGSGFRGVSPWILILTVPLAVAGWGVAVTLSILLQPLIGEGPNVFEKIETLPSLILILLCGALAPGLCEEVLFRGTVQGVLVRKGRWLAVLLTAILFAAFHLDPWRLIPLFFLGLYLGTLTIRCGSIWPSVVAHTTNNATAFFFMYRWPTMTQAELLEISVGLSVLFLLLFPVFWFATRRCDRSAPELSRVDAGFPAPLAIAFGVVGTGLVLVLTLGLAAMYFALHFKTETTVVLEPHVGQGEQVVLLTNLNLFSQEPQSGDIVLYEDELWFVAENEGEMIWIQRGDQQALIAPQQVSGIAIEGFGSEP